MKITMKRRHLTIALIATIATSLIIPYQIFAQNQGGGGGKVTPEDDIGISRVLTGTCIVWASNAIVDKSSWYSVMCRPSVGGDVQKLVMDFSPDTFDVTQTGLEPMRTLNLKEGNLSGNPVTAELTYTITTPGPNFIAAKGLFKIEIGHIINASPASPPSTYTVTVTTKEGDDSVIETFPPTTPVNLEFVDSAEVLDGSLTAADLASNSVWDSEIADGAVTLAKLAANSVDSNKILDGTIVGDDVAVSFMKRVTLPDNAAGNPLGWNPDGATTSFTISDPDVELDKSIVIVNLVDLTAAINCKVDDLDGALDTNTFQVVCSTPPGEGAQLHYAIINTN